MSIKVATRPGDPDQPNEDYVVADDQMLVVSDGLTSRIDNGCVHGVAWFARCLCEAVLTHQRPLLSDTLRAAIEHTAAQHTTTCDLANPATPCAAIGILRFTPERIDYLVLSDVTLVLTGPTTEKIISDDRVNTTALPQRAIAHQLPSGSSEKNHALIQMKKAEVAARNTACGYWIAGANPAAADHAIQGVVSAQGINRAALFTDGVTRLVDLFNVVTWPELLDALEQFGPEALLDRVRAHEAQDPNCVRWPRNKTSDDATAALWTPEWTSH